MAERSLSSEPAEPREGIVAEGTPAIRNVSWVQAVLLIMGAWCTVLASGALAPVLPEIRDAFASAQRLDLMVGFVATMPSLAVAIFAIPIGWIADRVGLTQVMLIGLAGFGVAGVIPFWLTSLNAIVATRFVVGIGEAAVMITSTALIGLLFHGPRRTRWLGIQVAAANFLGIGVLLAGGIIGLWGWRAAFWIYTFGLILLIPCLFLLPRPRVARPSTGNMAVRSTPSGLWRLVIESCFLIFVGSAALYSVIVQASFLFEVRGATDSAMRGMAMAAAAAGIALGATASGMITKWTGFAKVRIAFLLMGVGMVAMMMADSLITTALAAPIAGFGCGFVIPALQSRLLSRTPADQMGGVTGLWIAATFAGHFANPPLFIILNSVGGSQAAAMGMMGCICLVVCALLGFLMRTEAKPT